ncbi:MAG: response regulator [Candidatus Zhuqueibacterota bacterium]
MATHILFVISQDEKLYAELSALIGQHNGSLVVEHDLAAGIIQAQNKMFDIIVLDASVPGMPIEKTIQILKDINPSIKIIVKAHTNSKEFEAKIRSEKIYYYHLDSFGIDDLKLAIKSALPVKPEIQKSMELPTEPVKKKSILIVDENDDFLEIHRINLENHNFIVDISYESDEAFGKAAKNPPDILMVDINIQVGSDGYHFVDKIIQRNDMIEIPMLLFVSPTHSSAEEMIMSKVRTTLPTWTYLTKPVKIEDVIPAVEKLLQMSLNCVQGMPETK